MYEITPFKETLFLDTDTFILGNEDEIAWAFDKLKYNDLLICIADDYRILSFP